jgi:hypothetical protein
MFVAGCNMEGRMSDEGLTAHELRCLEHLKQARAVGLSIAAYARTHGLKVRMLYDAERQLKMKGVIADGVASQQLARSRAEGNPESSARRFVSVRVEGLSAEPCPWVPVLRVQHVDGHVVEFGSWPPADVLAAALSRGRDAAA